MNQSFEFVIFSSFLGKSDIFLGRFFSENVLKLLVTNQSQEIQRLGTTELQNSLLECTFSSTYNPQKIVFLKDDYDDILNSKSVDLEMNLAQAQASIIESIYEDDKASLTTHSKRVFKPSSSEPLDRSIASKLLHLCCMFDSVDCATAVLGGELGTVPLVNEMDETGKSALHTAAETHAARCVELLLKKRARTDLRTKDGRAQLALELSLCTPR